MQTQIALSDRPAVAVTASSVWHLDGTTYRRTPRHAGGRPAAPSLDGALDDDRAVTYRAAFLECDADGEWRLRLVPADRPAGAVGIVSGVLEASSWDLPGVPRFAPDDAENWTYPASPVPGDADLWPGERPFTAFGQFGPDTLDLRVFDQDVYWVDRHGTAHRIADMSDDYVTNVAMMLAGRAEEFHTASLLRAALQVAGDALLGRVNGELIAAELGAGSIADADPLVWLHSTPLWRALCRRLG